jgi:Ion channel
MTIRLTLRLVLTLVLLLGAYAVMPVGGGDWWWAALPATLIGLGLFTLIFIRQLRKVAHADFPVVRAVEALEMTVLLFLILFAVLAVQLEATTPGSYSESLTKIDALYFAVTTLATVGYGDIAPVSETARVVGIIQMLGNLVLLGVAVRLIGRATERAREQAESPAS